jgi:succinate dehydrogenase / fumarate reductase, iron-sulfur subunit
VSSAAPRTQSEPKTMNLTLRIWRQKDPSVKGKMVTYQLGGVSPDMSFL